jgi:hypothetical protein
VSATITHAQRDAVYDQILDRLSGIDDIWIAAFKADFETADRLGREYSDELRLVLDDLGWGDGPGAETIELTSAPEVLRRVFGRMCESAAGERARRQAGWIETRQLAERNRLVGEACEAVLTGLDAEDRQ